MEFNEFKPHSKSKSKSWVALSLIALVVVGGLVYYTWPREVAGEDTPPVLEMESSALQGAFVDDKIAFYTFEEKDLWPQEKATELSDNFGAPTTIEPNIHFYWLKSPRTFKDIRDFIEPKVGNQVFVAFYSPGEDGYEKGFHVYPKGPFQGTLEIEETEIASKEIPAYRPFIIISKEKTKVWGVEPENEVAVQFPNPLKNNEKGWTLVVATDDPKTALAAYEDRIDLNSDSKMQIWIQDAANSFERVDLENLTVGSYKTIWLKMKEKDSVSPAS